MPAAGRRYPPDRGSKKKGTSAVARLGFIFHIDQCIGCRACQVACKDKNHLEVGTYFRRVDTVVEDGVYKHYSAACNQCRNAACVQACPTGAMYIAKDGTVQHDDGKCIGCGSCMWACPYGSVKLSRLKGTATKCNSCIDLREKGEKPACVQACITHCLDFGLIEEDELNGDASFLPSPLKTQPTLKIVRGQKGEGKDE